MYIDIVSWIDSEFFNIRWGFLFDSLTVTMCVVITTISFFVHMYSTEYMDGDPHLPRFMSYLSFFSFTMLMLVIADNLMVLFLGWETVGVSSYLLISFWNTRIQANKSAVKAMIMNRIGDMGLALGIFGCFVTFGSVDYATIFATAPYFVNSTFTFFTFEVPTLDFICILLFVGAMGKSAMFLLQLLATGCHGGTYSSEFLAALGNNGDRRSLPRWHVVRHCLNMRQSPSSSPRCWERQLLSLQPPPDWCKTT